MKKQVQSVKNAQEKTSQMGGQHPSPIKRKKIPTYILVILLMFGGSFGMQAQKNYGVGICGVPINTSTVMQLGNIPGVSGTVTYNPETKILTLENATIDATVSGANYAISNGAVDGLKIKLIGKNKIKAGHGQKYCFELKKKTTIEGPGSVKLDNLIMMEDDVTIIGCRVHINISTYEYAAISGSNGHEDGILTLNSTKLIIYGDCLSGYIEDIQNLIMEDCQINSQNDAHFEENVGVVHNGSSELVKEGGLAIEPFLEICGMPVSDINSSDLSVIDGVTGNVSYNKDTKTLILNGATIKWVGTIIDSYIDDLKIELHNKNTLTDTSSFSYASFLTSRNATIFGTGPGDSLVGNKRLDSHSQLTIKDCYAEFSLIHGTGDENDKLFLDNVTIKAGPNVWGSIREYSNISFTNCAIVSPEGAEFDSGEQGIVGSDGNLVTEQIVIEPTIEAYELEIAGVQVTELNCNDLSQIDGVTGTVTYNNATKTLTLDGASINGEIVNDGIENLKITLVNENNITDNEECIGLYASTEISGNGSLICNNSIALAESPLTIKNCTIEIIDAPEYGFIGYTTSEEDLTINNATVKATGVSGGSIIDISNLTLINCYIVSPEGAVFDTELPGVVDANGNVIKEQIVIEPIEAYDLDIAGVPVTNLNCNDLSQIAGVEGTVTYDHTTKTLTLDGATINGAIENIGIEDLKITLVNENNITAASNEDAVYLRDATEINGNGSLICNNNIATEDLPLTIKNCTIEVNSPEYGIGNYGDELPIIIDNATIKATGAEGSIAGGASLNLIDCAIVSPEGAFYDTEEHAVVDANGNVITEQIVIEPTDAISEVSMNSILVYPNPTADILNIDAPTDNLRVEIFNIFGQNILEISNSNSISLKFLPQGTYIAKIYNNNKVSVSKIIKK